ncbi:MAG: prenyltransferase [Candidatus Thiodiazotropha endolucinida]
MNNKYTFVGALRPFSLVVAVATCGLGVSLALIDNADEHWLAWLVLLTGLLLQIAVNLVNDAPDLVNSELDQLSRQNILRNQKIGWIIMLLAVILGLYMVSIRGWPLLLLGMVGVAGAWGYTGGKVNYKQRGLGIVLVFLLMGVLLIGGSYYVLSGLYTWRVFWLSLPFSLLSSLLLLSNELRDYESDRDAGIRTLIAGRFYLLFGATYLATLWMDLP